MGRMYIPSTPASRGEVEVDEDAHEALLPEGLSHEETVKALEALAAELGYQLVPIEGEPDPGTTEVKEPAKEPAKADPKGGSAVKEPATKPAAKPATPPAK